MKSLSGKLSMFIAVLALLLTTNTSCLKEDQGLVEALCNGVIQGVVIDEYGKPVPGVRLELRGSDQAAETDPEGYFRIDHVPAGKASLDLIKTVEAEGNESGPVIEEIRIEAAVTVTVKPNGTVTIEIKIKIEIKFIPDCDCKPWCGIVGVRDTVTGARSVSAGGGATPRNCPHPVSIKVTDPAGNSFNPPQPPGRQVFNPAAPGPYKVQVSVCGKTKECSINF